MSAKQKMLSVLQNNGVFTIKQARNRFGIKNVAARIHDLRKEGYCIYSNVKKNSKGKKVTTYRIGNPSRAIVRAAVASGLYTFAA